jgi:hypothetical protein
LTNQRAARLSAHTFFSGFLIKKKSAAERTTSVGHHFIGPLAQAYVGPIVVRTLSCAGNGFGKFSGKITREGNFLQQKDKI